MINSTHILALSEPGFIRQQLGAVFCNGACNPRSDSFWRRWLFGETRR